MAILEETKSAIGRSAKYRTLQRSTKIVPIRIGRTPPKVKVIPIAKPSKHSAR